MYADSEENRLRTTVAVMVPSTSVANGYVLPHHEAK